MPLQLEKPVENISFAKKVYQLLKDQIILGNLELGEKLDIFELAEKLKVSRTPIKEAFNRLALEGLVTIHPQRGTFVASLEPHDVQHLLDVRLMMELWGARAAIQKGASLNLDEEMEEILGQCAPLLTTKRTFDYAAFNRFDLEFHNRIVAAAENPRLSKAYKSLNLHIQLLRIYWGRARDRATTSHAEHLQILEAFRGGEYSEVQSVMEAHIMSSANDIMEYLTQKNLNNLKP